jgi:hypothetical protein
VKNAERESSTTSLESDRNGEDNLQVLGGGGHSGARSGTVTSFRNGPMVRIVPSGWTVQIEDAFP